MPPQIAVHADPVREHHRRPSAALAVSNRPGAGQLDARRLAQRLAYGHLIRVSVRTGLGSRIVTPDVSPGWYPDPQTQRQLRSWNGAAWTEHTQPAGPATEA